MKLSLPPKALSAVIAFGTIAFTLHASHAQTLNYQLDDGTAENFTGSNTNQTSAFLNRFQVQGAYSEITSIEVQWGSFSSANKMVTAVVWSDPNQNSAPDDSLVIGESLSTLSDSASGWQSFDLTSDTYVGETGDYFFVGIYYTNGSDFSSDSLFLGVDISGSNQSFGAQIGPPDNPNDLSGYSQFGNLMIRATAIPEPSSLFASLLGGLLLFVRRRR